MPTEEEPKTKRSKTAEGKKSRKRKPKGEKKVTYKEKRKEYQFRVTKAPAGGDRLAIELARQQFASVQQEKDRAERLRQEELQRLSEERKAQEKRLIEERKAEEKRQKEILDDYKARAEADKKALEKFQQQTEPTLVNILDLYRALAKDKIGFDREQQQMAQTVAEFTDVLASLGMDPEKARVKATESSLIDLLERRKDKEEADLKRSQIAANRAYDELINLGWSEPSARQISELLGQRQTLRGDDLAGKKINEQAIGKVIEEFYKKEKWSGPKMTALKTKGLGASVEINRAIDKIIEREGLPTFETVPLPPPPPPLPSGSAGPPPLMEEAEPLPFPPVPVTPVPSDTLFNFPPPEEAPLIQPPPLIRKQKGTVGSELPPEFAIRGPIATYPEIPPELPPELTPITKAGSDYWTRVITEGTASPTSYQQEEKVEDTAEPKLRKKKTPGREYRLEQPITYYDPTNPVLPMETQESGAIIPFEENALLAGLKRTMRGDREPRPVESQPMKRYPRVDAELPPAFLGGGGGGGGEEVGLVFE